MKADILKCNVAIGGDVRNVLHCTNLTWPEVCIMRELHGEQSVNDIVVTAINEIDERSEFERIRFAYPEYAVKNLYPGVSPNVVFVAPEYIDRDVPRPTPAKKQEAHKHDNKSDDLL